MTRSKVGNLLTAALAHAPVSIVITTPNGRIVYVNPEFERVTGYLSAEALGRTPAILKSGRQPPEVYQRMWAALNAGQPWRGELVNRRKSGDLYAAELEISPVRDDDGRVTHFVASHRDVTRERALQAVLEDRARELALVRAEHDEFVAGVGGALAEPLQEVARAAGRLGRDSGAAVLEDSAQRLATRVDELLHLYRVGRDHAVFSRIELTEMLAEDRRATLEPPPLPVIFGNRALIRELFEALVTRAVHHGGASPRVTIHAAPGETRPGYVDVAVRDGGPPLGAVERERILVSMDLALCRKIAERHGGRVWAPKSDSGELRVSLPAAMSRLALDRDVTAARFLAERPAEPADEAPLELLVAESDPYTAERLADALGAAACVTRVPTAADAVARLAAAQFDAALIAADLPDAGGLELLTRLRHQAPTLPVIVVTGAGDERLAVLAMKLGAADYVTHDEITGGLRRAVRAAVQRVRTARELEAARGDLISIVTHDLKNPLANVLSYAELALDTVDGLPAEGHRHLERIRDNARFMFNLIDDILDTQRIDCGKLKLMASREDVAQLVRAAAERAAFLARDKEIALDVVLPSGPLPAPADARKIAQVLNNLLSNAIKFSSPKTRVEVGARALPDAVEVWVRDSGPGIQPAERELLFRKFSRTSVRPTRGEKSTGLGLYIVQEIIKLHGGEVRVDSEPGHGSTFSFRLPAV